MVRLEAHRSLDDEQRRAVLTFVDVVESALGRRPLNDHLYLDLVEGGRDGFGAVLAKDGDELVGYAQISSGHDATTLEVVVPAARTDLVGALVARARELVAANGGGEVQWWIVDPTEALDEVARSAGFSPGRTLLQMRVSLPLDDAVADPGRDVATRPFEPGRDEAGWLEVNNAAFAAHPEQGGWDLATLRQREAQSWFDPAGFRLFERDGQLAAFCWTKVHNDTTPTLGEIYVIAVHPDFAGLGLGKALTVAGLDHLAGLGIHTGMLYVDADNVAAVGLYRRLGFTTHRTDRAYTSTVPAAGPATTDPRGPIR